MAEEHHTRLDALERGEGRDRLQRVVGEDLPGEWPGVGDHARAAGDVEVAVGDEGQLVAVLDQVAVAEPVDARGDLSGHGLKLRRVRTQDW